jgi:hypothetical protein
MDKVNVDYRPSAHEDVIKTVQLPCRQAITAAIEILKSVTEHSSALTKTKIFRYFEGLHEPEDDGEEYLEMMTLSEC